MRNETASAQACYELRGGRLYVNGERQAVVPATVKTALFLYEAKPRKASPLARLSLARSSL